MHITQLDLSSVLCENIEVMGEDGIRINKYLAAAGVCSRREADRLVNEGRVLINGRICETGCRVLPSDIVSVDDNVVDIDNEKRVYLAYNKPEGIVCTSDKKEKNNIIDHINYPVRITYAGRLDKESVGLIILTNDGELINAMMRARNAHEKEYEVTVNKEVTPEFLHAMRNGVYLEELDETTRRCKTLKGSDDKSFNIILTQGLNRQIRRMCEALGYKVKNLKRIRIVNIVLGELPEGKYRELTDAELKALKTAVGI